MLHPGAVATDIVRDMPWLIRKVIGFAFMAPEKGGRTTVMLASDPALETVTGKYYDQEQLAEYSTLGDDEALRRQLWDRSVEATGLG